jgi:hypothetical protein
MSEVLSQRLNGVRVTRQEFGHIDGHRASVVL